MIINQNASSENILRNTFASAVLMFRRLAGNSYTSTF